MVQVENNDNKKKNGILPIVWLGGAGLICSIAILSILLSNKHGEVNTLLKQLSDTAAYLTNKNETLVNDLTSFSFRYDSLLSDYQAVNNDFIAQKERNKRLADNNTDLLAREKECRNEYQTLFQTSEQLRNDNESLKTEMVTMHSQNENMKTQLMVNDSVLSAQLAMLGMLDNKLKTDSSEKARLLDSIQHENTPGYFNNTELTGAYGLAKVDVKYSHYYFGFTTVNGYALNRHILAGIGVGLLDYKGLLASPLYLHFRYNFGKSGFNPYLYTDCGMVFKYEDFWHPMVFYNPGIGFSKSISDRLALNLGVGYLMQRNDVKSSFINLKLGFVFMNNGHLKSWNYPR
jgi:hypothetical protein